MIVRLTDHAAKLHHAGVTTRSHLGKRDLNPQDIFSVFTGWLMRYNTRHQSRHATLTADLTSREPYGSAYDNATD